MVEPPRCPTATDFKSRFENHCSEPEQLSGSRGNPSSDGDHGLVNQLGPSQRDAETGQREELQAERREPCGLCAPAVLEGGKRGGRRRSFR